MLGHIISNCQDAFSLTKYAFYFKHGCKYVLKSWKLWLYVGAVWILVFQQYGFGIKPWVTKNYFRLTKAKNRLFGYEHTFFWKSFKLNFFSNYSCGAIALAIHLILWSCTRLWKAPHFFSLPQGILNILMMSSHQMSLKFLQSSTWLQERRQTLDACG